MGTAFLTGTCMQVKKHKHVSFNSKIMETIEMSINREWFKNALKGLQRVKYYSALKKGGVDLCVLI